MALMETGLNFNKFAVEILVQVGCPVTQTLHAKLNMFEKNTEN